MATVPGYIHLELESLIGEEMAVKFKRTQFLRKLTPTYKTDGTKELILEDLRYQNVVLLGGNQDTLHQLVSIQIIKPPRGDSSVLDGFSYISMGTVPREQLEEVKTWMREVGNEYRPVEPIYNNGRQTYEIKMTWKPLAAA